MWRWDDFPIATWLNELEEYSRKEAAGTSMVCRQASAHIMQLYREAVNREPLWGVANIVDMP